MRVLVVTNMYPIPDEPSFGTFVKGQVEALTKAGVEVDVLLINGRKNKLNYIWGIFRFWEQLFKKKYILIHAHYIFSGLIARLQWLYPVVLTHHGIEVIKIEWVSKLVRFTHHWFDRVIVVAEPQRTFLQDPAIALIPCGIDFQEMRPTPVIEARASLKLPQVKKLVLWAGEHWRPEKRFSLVEETIALLKKQMQDIELVLVSGQPHSVIPLYMSACDVLLLTSLYEGSPMVIKEAMACNLPIVSTSVGDVPQVIAGVEGCYLSDPNPEDMVDKLSKALTWGQRTQGRLKVQYLSSDVTAQKVIAVYNELCLPEQRIQPVSLKFNEE